MIRHCVFLNLRNDADPGELAEVLTGLAAVTTRLLGASGFTSGPEMFLFSIPMVFPKPRMPIRTCMVTTACRIKLVIWEDMRQTRF